MYKRWITGIEQKFGCITGLLVLSVLLAVTQSVHAQQREAGVDRQEPRLRVAILTDTQSPDREKLELFSDLLGVMLQEGDGIALLERDQFEAVLQEIKVSQLVGADAVSQRLRASTLLDAEALVLVHRPEGRSDQIAVTVMETNHGLRLGGFLIADDDKIERVLPSISAAIRQELTRDQQGLRLILAVPPFVDARLNPEPARFGVQLAEVVQTMADNTPGVLVLEVDEARALAREMKLRGDDRLKALLEPMFLIGKIATSPEGGIDLDLVAQRSSSEPVSRTLNTQSLAEAVNASVLLGRELIKVMSDSAVQIPEADTPALIQRLKDSAAELTLVARHDQARDLLETAILLDPDDPVLRARVLDSLVHQIYTMAALPDTNEHLQARIALFEAGLEHELKAIDIILRQGKPTPETKGRMPGVNFLSTATACLIRLKDAGRDDKRTELTDKLRSFYQQLYQLVMGLEEEQLFRVNASNLAVLFMEQRGGDREIYLSEEQRLAVLLRHQNGPGASGVARHLWFSHDVVKRRQIFNGLDVYAKQLTPRMLMSLQGDRVGSTYNLYKGPVYRSDAIAARLQTDSAIPKEITKQDDPLPKIIVRPLVMRPKGSDGTLEQTPIRPFGWIDAGGFGELLYTQFVVYLLTDKDEIEPVFTLDQSLRKAPETGEAIRFWPPCFDGRYVWMITSHGPVHLFVLDLQTRRRWHFTEADDLPPTGGGAAIAPLGIGDVLLAGSTSMSPSLARCWSARLKLDPESGLSSKLIYQYMPREQTPDKMILMNYVRHAVTLTDKTDPARRVVLVDHQGWGDTFDYGQKMMISPDTGESRVLKWGKYNATGMGLSRCFTDDGVFYFTEQNPEVTIHLELVKCYDPVADRFVPIRPAFIGQGVSGMVRWRDIFLSTDKHGNLWGARQVTDIARCLGAISPAVDDSTDQMFKNVDTRDFGASYGQTFTNLIASRYYGLVAMLRHNDTDERRTLWIVELEQPQLARLDEDAEPPKAATRVDDRLVLPVKGSWSLDEAQRLAQAYSASLVNIKDRESFDRLGLLLNGDEKDKRYWVGLERRDDTLRFTDTGQSTSRLEGIKVDGLAEGPVQAGWSPPTLTAVEPDARACVYLQWTHPDARADEAQLVSDHPGPAWLPLVKLPAGRIDIGARYPDAQFASIEPRSTVEISDGLWMSQTEVTDAQWRHVMDDGPVPTDAPSPPANVRVDKAFIFCQRLSLMTGLNYRLPTEQEWEYACRAGTETAYASGDSLADLRKIGWCSYDGQFASAGNRAFVGSFEPNAWGLYDMHGNLPEWTSSYLAGDGVHSKPGPNRYVSRRAYIVRGGGWYDKPSRCTSSARRHGGYGDLVVGMRVVLDTRESSE